MPRFFALVLIALLVPLGVVAQESLTLTTPVVKTATTWSIDVITLNIKDRQIAVYLSSDAGDSKTKIYDATTTPTGATALSTINTRNNSVTSLIKWVYQRLQTEGVIAAGNVTGTPQ